MRIAILGAAQSGKTCLAEKLRCARPDCQIFDDPAPGMTVDLALLMGLDLPSAAGQSDELLRKQLRASAVSYSVVYGLGDQRLRNALRLIAPEPAAPARWTRVCETCSDPDCEHLLFTGLHRSKAADLPQW
ncbi:MAG: hypothetical protein ACO24Y_02490 [Hylemonella sp.]